MKNYAFVLAFLFAGSAFANVPKTLTCSTVNPIMGKSIHKAQLFLQVDSKGQLQWADTGSADQTKSVPKDSPFNTLPNNGQIRHPKGDLEFFGDDDGIMLVYLYLYKNSEFKVGYLKVVDNGNYGFGNHYTPVSCSWN